MYKKIILLVAFFLTSLSYSQLLTKKENFTKQDTLRGSITKERVWWNLTSYHLDIEVKPSQKWIGGSNIISYTVLQPSQRLQVDLQSPMKIEKVTQDGKELFVEHEGNAHFILLEKKQKIGARNSVKIYYSGHPRVAKNAPWDGGFSWKKDSYGNPFVATSCQGLGASVWWPNKDHMYDEVENMKISITIPKGLTNVSNGVLKKVVKNKNTTTFHYAVSNPINNYGVNVNIGDYVHFKEVYNGEKGPLNMDYYVLRDNLEKAKKHFKDAPKMMKAFEHWFGPYPFYEDGFKLIEVPYLGMEHQSSVTYGNKYKKGYLGRDLSGTGWGLKFDFIIIHESGHEWFANNITNKDMADMWIHESFTAYSEAIFLDYYYGKKASREYVIGTRKSIRNKKPMIGPYNVNKEGGDLYYKGANMLHMIRTLIEDDTLWRSVLRGLNKEFYHKTVTTKEIEDYISKHTKKDLSAFFNQYLRTIKVPILEYKIENNILSYRYTNIVENFDMPIQTIINHKTKWLFPSKKWKHEEISNTVNKIEILEDFYIQTKKM